MLSDINFDRSKDLSVSEVYDLYTSVGWSAYTKDMPTLMKGIENSGVVVSTRYQGKLIGLCRVITDFYTIAYIQDILVDTEFHRRGVATGLLTHALEGLQVRQTLLLADDDVAQRAFYESMGFTEIRDVTEAGLRSFVHFN